MNCNNKKINSPKRGATSPHLKKDMKTLSIIKEIEKTLKSLKDNQWDCLDKLFALNKKL
jgi:hypothetical protein